MPRQYLSNRQKNLKIGVSSYTENDQVLDVVGNISVSGIVSTSEIISDKISVSGVSTFTSDLDINASIDVDGHTELDDVNVSGVITATSFSGDGSNLTNIPIEVSNDTTPELGGDLNVNGNDIAGTGNVNLTGVVTATSFVGDLTGNADTSTALETARNFEITGDVVASAISFDGTGNVSLAATIQPNSVELGNDTTGDYVESVSGTANEIQVTSGTGEGSTPTIGFVTNPTIGGNVNIGQDLNVSGISTLGTVQISSGIVTATSGVVTYYGDGSKLIGLTASQVGALDGVIIQEEGSTVGSVESINFVSDNLTATASGAGATITLTETPEFDNLTVTGVSTLGNTTIGLGNTEFIVDGDARITGVITANRVYSELYGEFTGNSVVSDSIVGTSLSISGVSTLGNTTIGLGNTEFIVDGDARITGVITANRVYSELYGEFTGNSVVSDSIVGTSLSISGVSTLGTVQISSGIVTATSGVVTYYGDGSKLSDLTASQVGALADIVEDTTPQLGGDLDVNGNDIIGTGNVNLTGVITATSFVGDGTGITGLTASQVGALDGVTIQEEGSTVGSVGNINFVSDNLTATASGAGATITLTDTPTFTTVTGNLTGTATTATVLETARNFSVTGDFVTASAVSFDGTGAVALAATITADSITLGTYTSGDYVESVSGTANEIQVTGGTGEGSTPTIGFVANPTIGGNVTVGQDLTVTRDLQVTRNLNVDGTVTIGGTSATIFAETLKISDPDIILGIRTDANGNDISNDTTANHGGVALASTEGSPLVTLVNPGAGETLPSTYKKIMWFKSGSFTGLNTDAWLSNYAFGVGTTSMSDGTKFAVGNIEANFDDITVVRNINSTGVITATSFDGSLATTDLTGTITNAQLAGSIDNTKLSNSTVSYGGIQLSLGGSDATPAFDLSDATNYPYTSLTGITTDIVGDTTPQLGGDLDVNGNDITGTGNVNLTGVVTATAFVGDGTGITGLTASQVGALAGVTIQEEGSTPVGTAGSVGIINFVSDNLTATVSGAGATITLTETPEFDNLTITGVSTLGTVKISSGIITAVSGIVTYYGDGSNLTGVGTVAISTTAPSAPDVGDLWYSPDYARTLIYYDDGSSQQWVDASPFNVGILTVTNFTASNLNVTSSLNVSGVVTATAFVGDGTGITGLTASQVGALAGVSIREEGIVVGTTGSVGDINFVSDNLTATASGAGATITLTETPEFDNLTITGVTTSTSFVKSGGTSSQFLKADGSVDSSTYITSADGGNAATLDSLDSTQFLRSDASDTASGAITLSVDTADALNFSASSTNDARGISFNNRTALSADYNDGWLRLNQSSEFSNGVYTPGNLRTGGNIYVTNATNYLSYPTGNYGSIQINGSGAGNYEGFSIDGRVVFMHDGSTNAGIYNDVNNHWMFYGILGGSTYMYENGSWKIRTTSSGIEVSGDVNSTSDIKLKKNIETIDNALDKVLRLRGVYFDWKEEVMGTDKNIGLIAQEVEKVVPELVTENERENSNNTDTDEEVVSTETIKSVSYGNITAILIEAMKEQQKQIDTLTKRIEELGG